MLCLTQLCKASHAASRSMPCETCSQSAHDQPTSFSTNCSQATMFLGAWHVIFFTVQFGTRLHHEMQLPSPMQRIIIIIRTSALCMDCCKTAQPKKS